VTPCDTKQKTSFDFVVTDLSPSTEELKNRITQFVMDSKDSGTSTVTIKSDGNGWPIDRKVTGVGADADTISLMLFLLRKPLWSPNAKQTDWIA